MFRNMRMVQILMRKEQIPLQTSTIWVLKSRKSQSMVEKGTITIVSKLCIKKEYPEVWDVGIGLAPEGSAAGGTEEGLDFENRREN